jgi:hypothetical protein
MVALGLPLISTLFIPPSGRGLLKGQNHDPAQDRIYGAATTERTFIVGELAALKADAHHWLTDPEYAALRHPLDAGQGGRRVEARPPALWAENRLTPHG